MPADLGFPDWDSPTVLADTLGVAFGIMNNVPYAAFTVDVIDIPPGWGHSAIDSSWFPPLVLVRHEINGYVLQFLSCRAGGTVIFPLYGGHLEGMTAWPWPGVTYTVTGYPPLP